MIPPQGRALSADEQTALVADMAAIVQSSHLFKSLDDAGRARVLASGYVTTFGSGDVIIKQGDRGTQMYLVLNGSVAVETSAPGKSIHLAELGRGGVFGEVSVLTGRERTATVTALGPVDCVCFEGHRIQRVLADYPKVRTLLEKIIARRAEDTVEKIIGQ